MNWLIGLSLALLLAISHWIAYQQGAADIKDHTRVVRVEKNPFRGFGPYYGKCSKRFDYCAIDSREYPIGVAAEEPACEN